MFIRIKEPVQKLALLFFFFSNNSFKSFSNNSSKSLNNTSPIPSRVKYYINFISTKKTGVLYKILHLYMMIFNSENCNKFKVLNIVHVNIH